MALTEGGSIIDVGWVRHAVCAVTHRVCRQALINKCIGCCYATLWWVTQKTLTHPTLLFKLSAISDTESLGLYQRMRRDERIQMGALILSALAVAVVLIGTRFWGWSWRVDPAVVGGAGARA